MKRVMICMAASLMVMGAAAQKTSGGISSEMLRQIENAQPRNATDKALFNAIASNAIDDLAKNFSNQGALDTHFSHETKSQSSLATAAFVT